MQWYAADQWKITRGLTLNYGLRFGYHSPFEQIDGQGSNFDPSLFNPAQAVTLYESACAVSLLLPRLVQQHNGERRIRSRDN